MSLGQLQGTTVLRATVHGTAGDALVLRQGAERLLSGAGDLVPGMGPEEILCIRRLAAWAPVEASASGEANRAMRESAQRLARAAARPALAPVPPLAQAVLFADRAELLACLARDWLQGLCGLRWWWKALLRNRDASVVLQDAWSEGARDAPAAMAKLASQDLAVHFVRALGAVDAQRLAKAIARSHGVPAFREPSPSISRRRAPRAGTTPLGQRPRPDEAAPEDVRVHVPEALAPSLSGPARALLALALVAHRAPATARSARFARAIVAWAWQPGGSFEARNDARPAMTLPEAWSGAGTFPAGAADASPADRLMDPSGMLQPPAMPLYRRKAEGGARDPAGEPSREAVRPHSDRQEGTTVSRRGIVDSREPTPDSRERAMDRGELEIRPPALPLTSGVGQLPGVALETAVETNLGGLFYLVNAALRLGLYGDFMSPRKPGIELPLWDFLALAAGEWLRDEVR
ncbi:MAG: hypothetical protein OEX21_13330, partial [Betaproteobacteria bacterium]|nr:hypothetical protein [Betaproteobacteria bacterium]